MIEYIKTFLTLESAGGIVLMVVAALAVAIANSPLAPTYHALLAPLEMPINDGLMAIFFLLIGLEIKREICEGELSTRAKATLPLAGALGGVIVPALIYAAFNYGERTLRGWAIPCATDIAFSLGVLSLFGSRVPAALKIFLMALAVIDDLAAVMIIALFYSAHLVIPALGIALCGILILFAMNRAGVSKIMPYLMVGVGLWAAVLQSGIHPTIAGVILGLMIPLPVGKKLIHRLHPWVAFGVMPLFAFANAGVQLTGIDLSTLSQPLPLGIIFGLFFGKQYGIFMFSWLCIRFKISTLPEHTRWKEFYAVCALAGIGFTMSLFIGNLAFTAPALESSMRLGVVLGSLLSAAFGALLLARSLRTTLSET